MSEFDNDLANGKIKVTLGNWLGKVVFETNQKNIDDFNEEYEFDFEELNAENNYTYEYVGIFYFDPYLIFEPNGNFIVISKFYLSDEEVSAVGYEFDFDDGGDTSYYPSIKKYLFEGWLFIDNETDELVKDKLMKAKLLKITNGDGEREIDNNGNGCIRLSDFDFQKFCDENGINI